MLKQALHLALQEYKIFPCATNGKKPLTKNGYKDASRDKDTIERWWAQHPNANIGLVTGKINGIIVIDVDVKNGAQGLASADTLQEWFGVFDTLTIDTPSGGVHYYFRYPEHVKQIKNRVNIMPGIDIRGDGGYIIAPGSKIHNNLYQAKDVNRHISTLPDGLITILTSNTSNRQNTSPASVITEGSRNETIFKMAVDLKSKGIDYEHAKNTIINASIQKCSPPFPVSEAIRCLDSAWNYSKPHNLTELGNAKRLVSNYGETIRYVVEFKKWLIWRKGIWTFDDTGEVFRLAKETVRKIYQEAWNEPDDDKRKRLSKFAAKSESKHAIEALVKLATTEKDVAIKSNVLDNNPFLLGVKNGTINLKTGLLNPGSKSDFITKQIDVFFDTEASCPTWIDFINQITDCDQDMVAYLQKAIGYSLTGDTSEQKIFFLFGYGANGKSVLINTLQDLLGGYAMQTPVSTLMTKNKGSINNDVARLKGARFVATTETEEGSRFNESELKLLTGGDTITARFLHQEHFEFRPEFKLWISGNHKPVPGSGHSIWRRLILIPFEVRIPDHLQDKKLSQKLKRELSGILNWSIEGCIKWQQEGLTTPEKIINATKEYKSEMDTIQNWMTDCWVDASNEDEIQAKNLYQSYSQWAADNGEGYTMSSRILGQKLKEQGFTTKRKGAGRFYTGIKIRDRYNF